VKVEGRAWVFSEANVNTDLMMPAATFRMPRAEQAKQVFATYRPGWADAVGQGDVIIGGRNFGTGSSRPAPTLMADLGITAVIAESLNAVAEPEVVALDLATGAITNRRTGATLAGSALPAELIAIIADGGLLPRLERGGFVEAGRGR
jgi:3-isopropylmalate/(R)-2-methylmalate dehydratase small subunit